MRSLLLLTLFAVIVGELVDETAALPPDFFRISTMFV
jgi:hypothetical protein